MAKAVWAWAQGPICGLEAYDYTLGVWVLLPTICVAGPGQLRSYVYEFMRSTGEINY